jgi:hypothetical protein
VDVSRLPATQPMTKGTACRSMSIPSPPHKASTSRSSRVDHLARRPPAEGDFQEFFRVTPPTVHRMIVTLHERGPIARVPGQPRSITWWSRPMICRGFNRSKSLRRGTPWPRCWPGPASGDGARPHGPVRTSRRTPACRCHSAIARSATTGAGRQRLSGSADTKASICPITSAGLVRERK